MTISSGTKANKNGDNIEKIVEGMFNVKGFESVKYKDYIKNPYQYGEDILLRNVPYESIYEHNAKTEFVLKRKNEDDIRIECKWQQTKGSADEKLPYLYLNCVEQFPEKEIIIVIDGDGFKKGSKEWLKRVAEDKWLLTDKSDKMIQVKSLSEFVTWFNRKIV